MTLDEEEDKTTASFELDNTRQPELHHSVDTKPVQLVTTTLV